MSQDQVYLLYFMLFYANILFSIAGTLFAEKTQWESKTQEIQ